MRRRVPVVERARPELDAPPFSVDAWLTDDDRAYIEREVAGITAGAFPGELEWALRFRAFRKWERALAEWAEEHDVAPDEVASIHARARGIVLADSRAARKEGDGDRAALRPA